MGQTFRADHFAQTAAGSGQVLLQFVDSLLQRLKLDDLLFKSPVGIGEFGDACGQLLVADLVELPTELLADGFAKTVTFLAEGGDLLAGHEQVGLQAGRAGLATV